MILINSELPYMWPLFSTDIFSSISVAAPFSGLWQFPIGHGFKQWTGDDSKALMKVWDILLAMFEFSN